MLVFSQAGEHYQALSEKEKENLACNIAESLMFIEEEVQKKVLRHLQTADEDLSRNVAKKIGI